MKKIIQLLKSREAIAVLLLLSLGSLSSCGGGSENLAEPNGDEDAVVSQLAIYRVGGFQALEELSGVSVGETVSLEVKNAESAPRWFSSDESRGIFTSPGELLLLKEGEFDISAQSGGLKKHLKVVVEAVSDSEDPQAEDPENPDPKPKPKPLPKFPDFPIKNKDPVPPAPIPDPVPSDIFMDEVIHLQIGFGGGYGQESMPDIVLGAPKGPAHVLSLGEGGVIVLKSDTAIVDGPGEDFVVFENSFFINGNPQNPNVELGEVEVSQDGIKFYKFTCHYNDKANLYPGCAGVMPTNLQQIGNPLDPKKSGGDGFDLEELGLDWIYYIRITDIHDKSPDWGPAVNVKPKIGFDLDAVGIVHQ